MSLNGALGLGLVFTARDFASGGILRLERAFLSMEGSITGGAERIRGAFRQLGMGLSIFAAGAATLAGSFALTSKAAEFEQAIASVGAVSQASKTEIEALENAALRMGIETQYAPTEATKALEELAQAGFNARQSITLLKPVLDLAAGSLGKLSPEQAAGVAVQALRAFRIEAKDAGLAVDQMLKAANVFSMNAGELPLALGHAADGANVLSQSLDETLVAFGLVHNIIPGVERAATGVSVAMERMADPRTQQILRGIGVEATDASGGFRKFLDILRDLAPKLDAMTEKDRASFLLKAFGHHALAGVGDILTQLQGGITKTSGEIVRGAEAVKYLRDEMQNASGTAGSFSKALLDTLGGQEKLLRGSLETLEIMVGKSFAQVFRPIVEAVLNGLNTILEIIQATPAPVKRALAGIVVAAGAFLTLVGGVIALQGLVGVLGIAFEALGVSLGALATTLASAAAVLALFGVLAAGAKVAFDKNLGAIADVVRRVGDVVRLVFQGISQFVEQGGFSGALREELGRAENAGIKRFLVSLWMLWFRLEKFWTGIKEGFASALEAAQPIFRELAKAFDAASTSLGALIGAMFGSAAKLPSDRYLAFGQIVGRVFAWIVTVAAKKVQEILAFLDSFFTGAKTAFGWIRAAAGELWDALGQLRDAWRELVGAHAEANGSFDETAFELKVLGRALAWLAGVAIAGTIGTMARFVHGVHWLVNEAATLKKVLGAVGDVVLAVGRVIVWFFTEVLPNALASAGRGLRSALEGLGSWGASLLGLGDSDAPAVPPSAGEVVPLPPARVAAVTSALRTAADPAPASAERASAPAANASSAEPLMSVVPNTSAAPPITVNLQVDGETLARASARGARDLASRSLSPVPSY